MANVPKEDIVGIECKYATYQAATDGTPNDLLLIKEVIHTKDGGLVPNIRLVENFKRPFYITKKPYQNHKDKKEHEDIDKVDKFLTTQVQMPEAIQRALGYRFPNPKMQLREVCKSPYVYFADITTPTIVKQMYREKYPNAVSRNTVAVLDTERDVTFGTEDTILVSVTMKDKIVLGIVRWWADRIPDCINTIQSKYKHYLSEITIKGKDGPEHVNLLETRSNKVEIIVRDTPGQVIRQVMRRVHEMNPDFLAIWNMNYDVPELLRMLAKDNIAPEDVFCHPTVPKKYRKVWYKEAKAQRETNSKTISQHPADLWHVLFCQAGFYVIDAMCLFKKIRTAKGNEASYALDYILRKYLGIGKLDFEEADAYTKLKRHQFLQREYPAEYAIYNIFDCMSIELLDEKTNDLGMTITSLAEISEYSIFPSMPKRLVDVLHFFFLDYKKVAGSVGADVITELDEGIIDLGGWIVTLPAYAVEENGLYCIEEVPELQTMMRVQTADADILQAYPTGEIVLNISKETTCMEVLDIIGVPEEARRRAGINLTGGKTNAIEICNDIMNLPYIDDVLAAFEADIELGLVA